MAQLSHPERSYHWSFGRVATVLQVEVERAHGTAVIEAGEKIARGAARA